MLRQKEYLIDLIPVAWKRAGVSRRTFYDRQSHDKLAVGLYLQQQHGTEKPFLKPLAVELTFYLPFPKTAKRYRSTSWHATIPDIDNYCKFILDAVTSTGIIWKDDALISSLVAQKLYDEHPRTHLIIRELV